MADNATSKIDAAAEKAYAEAAAKKVETATVAKAVAADPKPAAKVAEVAKAVKAPAKKKTATKKKAAKKAAPKKVAAKKTAARKPAVKKVAAKKAAPKKTAAARKAAPATSTVTKLKDTIMAKADTTKMTETAKTMAADAQTRIKGAYTKGTEVVGDVVEFNKHNLEAVVESGKVLANGMQGMAREGLEDTKKAAEQVTEDVKLMAAVKSPTELMKLQGDLARRNFDAAMAYSSKSTEAWLKLANEAFAPISSRVSEAREVLSKAA
ncbi:phasin family protein [Parerythrobacter jejuensis]|uniref:TIGR01841 family phasin n=1 Tax=Parerythrobacter jejuensis TaxID=795812 RepID=A0A845ALD5_9SPHN|nr:phasin family protein [Parerythrobacter jejuensis]MXP30414.1 TIGR01841 family phasin [Parerythrobacter jejuensis]MXP33174.1 TIGR01841 family phasin [Parerythrobacter jejuensis]